MSGPRGSLPGMNRPPAGRVSPVGRTLLLDAFGGLAGDMLLGGLLDLGASADLLRLHLSSLGLPRFELVVEPTERRSLGATRARFEVPDESDHRHLPEILAMLRGSSLPELARERAERTFHLLAEAEARVHRIPEEQVHFHEVGAADAILDIAGVCLALHELGVERLLTGPLPAGTGCVQAAHGELPVPAPATLILLEGFTLVAGAGAGEMVTPTGAALLRCLGAPLPPGTRMRPERSGYGAGTREASILRLTLLEPEAGAVSEPVRVLECHLDDATGEELGFLMERLFEAGAVDVAYTPLVMKKGRPGVALTCMAPTARADSVRQTLLTQSSTLGVREETVWRSVLPRQQQEVDTRFGRLPLKVAGGRGEPEYEPCAAVARERGVPLREVYDEVRRAWRER